MGARFGDFEFDPRSGELVRGARRVRLQPLPARLLTVLLERPGEAVTRDELRARLWNESTFVEFGGSLNFAVKQLRRALQDPAEAPAYVETLPRVGYRFKAAVRASAAADDLARQPPKARERYLRGRYHADAATPDRSAAAAAFRQAIAIAPRFARAHAALALCLFDPDLPPAAMVPEVEDEAGLALALHPALAEAHLALARVALYVRFDRDRAGAELDLALSADPLLAEGWLTRAAWLASGGRVDEAVAAAEHARSLAPASLLVRGDIAWFLLLARRLEAAEREAEAILELDPDDVWAPEALTIAAWLRGDDVALVARGRALQARLSPGAAPPVSSVDELWRWQRGFVGERLQRGAITPAAGLLPEIAQGRTDVVVERLQAACREHFGGYVLPFLAVDPRFDSLRGDPRFRDVLRLAGLQP